MEWHFGKKGPQQSENTIGSVEIGKATSLDTLVLLTLLPPPETEI